MSAESPVRYWTPDRVAECLPVSEILYTKLWRLLDDMPEQPFSEVPDDISEGDWWEKLTSEERQEIVEAYEKEMLP